MSFETHLAIWVAIGLAIIGIFFAFWAGIRALRKGRTLKFFRMRRDHMVRGWRLLCTSVILPIVVVILRLYGFWIMDSIFEPTPTWTLTPTVTLTPTITQTPTISLTPTITPTPAVTDTPTASATPRIPLAVESQFESTITPNPDSIISPLVFAKGIDDEGGPELNRNLIKAGQRKFSGSGKNSKMDWGGDNYGIFEDEEDLLYDYS